MQTRNVHYSQQPERVIVSTNGSKAIIEFPINVREIAIPDPDGDRTEWVAEVVYYMYTSATPDLEERVSADYETWLAKAIIPEAKETTLDDLAEALDAIMDILMEV